MGLTHFGAFIVLACRCSAVLTLKVVSFQVGKLNPKDHSFSLKDELYRHVQRDWPGYLEEEKQLVHRLLIRYKVSIIVKNVFGSYKGRKMYN